EGRSRLLREESDLGICRDQPHLRQSRTAGRPRRAAGPLRRLQRHAAAQRIFRMSWDHTFSPTLLNHFYAGGNNWRENHDPPQAPVKSGINWKDKVCLAGVPDCDQNLLRLSFSEGYTTWGGQANNGSENTIYAFNNDLTWIKGRHAF